jgi:heat shock protein HslJ
LCGSVGTVPRMRFPILLGLACIASSLAVGCAADPNATKNADATPLVMPLTISGSWNVVGIETLGGAGLIRPAVPEGKGPPRTPTLSFDPPVGAAGGRMVIFTGVNKGTGHYSFSPGERDVGAIAIDRIATTRMAGPEDAMAFEADLLEALPLARTVKRTAEGVVIDCGEARVILTR